MYRKNVIEGPLTLPYDQPVDKLKSSSRVAIGVNVTSAECIRETKYKMRDSRLQEGKPTHQCRECSIQRRDRELSTGLEKP